MGEGGLRWVVEIEQPGWRILEEAGGFFFFFFYPCLEDS